MKIAIEDRARSYWEYVATIRQGKLVKIEAGCRRWKTFAEARRHYDVKHGHPKWHHAFNGRIPDEFYFEDVDASDRNYHEEARVSSLQTLRTLQHYHEEARVSSLQTLRTLQRMVTAALRKTKKGKPNAKDNTRRRKNRHRRGRVGGNRRRVTKTRR